MSNKRLSFKQKSLAFMLATACILSLPRQAAAENEKGFLESVKKHITLASTAIENGDLNPYAILVAPTTIGKIHKDDVLVDNFNDISNLQGTGTTIVDYNPTTKQMTLFAKIPKQLAGCPGGVGLTTAMTMLKSGWIIVGSTPSKDGTTKTIGKGCLIVLDPNGNVVNVIADAKINAPWGNVATIEDGSSATLFVSMTGFAVQGPEVRDEATGYPVISHKATVLRLDLKIEDGKPPEIKGETVIADGFGTQANRDSFIVGPTGLALATDGKTLYVSDGVANRISAVDDAPTRKTSAGVGREVTKEGLLQRPLAMVMEPGGHLLVTNALNGQVVEVDPIAKKQLYAQWIDADQAQTPPGNGDLFGLAMTPDGKGFYYVEDDMNTLVLAK